MSILNQANDGRHSELIVLFRAIAHFGPTKAEELLQNCSANSDSPHSRGALSRWTELGLFVEKDGVITLAPSILRKRGESIDVLTNRLPSYCRRFILETIHCLPLWPEGGGEPLKTELDVLQILPVAWHGLSVRTFIHSNQVMLKWKR